MLHDLNNRKKEMIELFLKKRGIETLRQPDRLPRCYEMTDSERLERALLQSNNLQEKNQLLAHELDLDQHYYWGS